MSMNRREFLGLMAAGAAGLASEAAAGAKRPNLILIMADDLSARAIGCYGHRTHRTPNLDALAKGGVMFRTCWANPICSPSRAEIMTGRYGFRTRWFHNNMKPSGRDPGYDLAKSQVLFSEVLKAAGYATCMAGKWQLSGRHPTRVFDHGFDEYCMWAGMTGGLPPGHRFDGPIEKKGMSLPGRAARYWHPAIVRNAKHVPTKPDDYGPDMFVDFLNDFIGRHRHGPFLAYFPMCLPHKSWDFELNRATYVPVPELDANGRRTGRRTKDTLRSNVEYIDHLVGRLVARLDQLGIRNDTIVMFTCDNGTAGYGKGRTTMEHGPRVPMIVNCPGRVKAIGPCDELTDFSDVLPTLAELAGARLPADWVIDGKSFAPVLRGEPGHRQWVFSCYATARFLRDKRWLRDGDGKFWDCGDRRDEKGYKDVTTSADPEAVAARDRFAKILEGLPAPDPNDPVVARFNDQRRKRREARRRRKKQAKSPRTRKE